MFELAVRYLLDPSGLRADHTAIRDAFLDVRSGHSFETAFERRVGLPRQDFEGQFFDRIRQFLR